MKLFDLLNFVKKAYFKNKFDDKVNYQMRICDFNNKELYKMSCDAYHIFIFFDTSCFTKKIMMNVKAFLLNNPENRKIACTYESKIYYLSKKTI